MMKAKMPRTSDSVFRKEAALLGLAAIVSLLVQGPAIANVQLWDAGSRPADTVELENRSDWKLVPSELFSLEKEPAKAASDPGYYGREYSFAGDAVVETAKFLAVFRSTKGRVEIYSKEGNPAQPTGGGDQGRRIGGKIAEVVPLQTKAQPGTLSRCEILRNADDEVALQVVFSGTGSPDASAVFLFDKTDIVEIKPAKNLRGISLRSPLEYGVAPGFIGDDSVYAAADYSSANSICIPAEHVFVGLLKGENAELVTTWPETRKSIGLSLGNGPEGKRQIESIDFAEPEQSIYVAALAAPGIWHKETLSPSFLEKEVKLDWKRPFPARWKTQLNEADVKTTFAFRESRGTVWRGVAGSYDYPVWFEGDEAFYHLGKKVPPKGESLIYFLEGRNTPVSMLTPVDILKATLGRPACEPLLDMAGRKLRTHHRRGGEGVHRACTCGCTEAIQWVFEKGEELAQKEYIGGALEDMMFFVQCHLDRIDEYRRFADDISQYLQAQRRAIPELKPYLEGLEQVAQQIPQEYEVQKPNMKSLEYAQELKGKTLALTGSKTPDSLKAYLELLKAWRAMGGAQDYIVARCHMVTRKLFQEAGYGCAEQPKAAQVAMAVRARCRQALRNPDGYEIWADY